MWADALLAFVGQLLAAVIALAFLLQLFRPFRFLLHSSLAVGIVSAGLLIMSLPKMQSAHDFGMAAVSIAYFAVMAWPLAFGASLLGGLLRHGLSRFSQRSQGQQ